MFALSSYILIVCPWTEWAWERWPWTLNRDDRLIEFKFTVIPREARPKASRSGVYNFVPQRAQAGWNLVWSLRSYISVRLVYAGNDVTRPCAGGLMVWGAEKLRSSGLRAGGSNPARCFFFSSFFFSFFFCFESWAFPWAFPCFLFSFWIKIK